MSKFIIKTQAGQRIVVNGRSMTSDRGIVVIFDGISGNHKACFALPQFAIQCEDDEAEALMEALR